MPTPASYKVTIHFSHSILVVRCIDFRVVYADDDYRTLKGIEFQGPAPYVQYFDPAKVLAITSEAA